MTRPNQTNSCSTGETLQKAVVQATTEVFATMLQMSAVLDGVHAEQEGVTAQDFVASISIFSEQEEGTFILSCSTALARRMIANILGLPPDALSLQELCDGVGEIINMIVGNVKYYLSQGSETQYSLSLPSVVYGKECQIHRSHHIQRFSVFTFRTPEESFQIQAHFRDDRSAL